MCITDSKSTDIRSKNDNYYSALICFLDVFNFDGNYLNKVLETSGLY